MKKNKDNFDFTKVTDIVADTNTKKEVPIFETKANDAYAKEFIDEIKKTSIDVLPTIFPLGEIVSTQRDLMKGSINHSDYSLSQKFVKSSGFFSIFLNFDKPLYFLSRIGFVLLTYIGYNIKINANRIFITEEDFYTTTGLSRVSLYRAIKELIEFGIIAETSRKSLFIVNHRIIFKGNQAKFIQIYNEKFEGKPAQLDEKGRIIIED